MMLATLLAAGLSAAPVDCLRIGAAADGPRPVHWPPARYPQEARREHLEGTVVLELTIDANGAVARVGVARASPHAVLDAAAVTQAKRIRFEPYVPAGSERPVCVVMPFPVDFDIRESDERAWFVFW